MSARVVIFAGFRIAHIRHYYTSTNPTYDGIPAMIFGLVEIYSSVITTTTPLLKGFIVRFMVVGKNRAKKPVIQKPLDTLAASKNATNMVANRMRNKQKGRAVEGGTFTEYEQWMPNERGKRQDSQYCGDTDVTAKTDDDRSDRTLHRDRERQREIDRDVIGLAEEP
jgi:hypothetical protein